MLTPLERKLQYIERRERQKQRELTVHIEDYLIANKKTKWLRYVPKNVTTVINLSIGVLFFAGIGVYALTKNALDKKRTRLMRKRRAIERDIRAEMLIRQKVEPERFLSIHKVEESWERFDTPFIEYDWILNTAFKPVRAVLRYSWNSFTAGFEAVRYSIMGTAVEYTPTSTARIKILYEQYRKGVPLDLLLSDVDEYFKLYSQIHLEKKFGFGPGDPTEFIKVTEYKLSPTFKPTRNLNIGESVSGVQEESLPLEKSPSLVEESLSPLEESPSHLEELPSSLVESSSLLDESPNHQEVSRNSLEETPKLVEQSPNNLEESPSSLGESLSHFEESPKLPEESPSFMEESPSPLEESLNYLEESLSPLEEALNPLEKLPSLPKESPSSPEETSSPLEESLDYLEESPSSLEESPSPLEETPNPLEESPSRFAGSAGPLRTTVEPLVAKTKNCVEERENIDVLDNPWKKTDNLVFDGSGHIGQESQSES